MNRPPQFEEPVPSLGDGTASREHAVDDERPGCIALSSDALETAIRSGGIIQPDTSSARTNRQPIEAHALRCALRTVGGGADPRGITLRDVDLVGGGLDLSNMEIVIPLAFENCTYSGELNLEGADLRSLRISGGGPVPGLLGNGCRVRRDLVLDDTRVSAAISTFGSTHHTAAIWLCEADIGGRLLVRSTTIDGQGGRSVQADRIRIGGNLRLLDGSHAIGEVRLLSAQIAGSIDIVASSITADHETALELAEACLGGSLFINDDSRYGPDRAVIDGVLVLSDVTFGAFVRMKGASLTGRAMMASGPFDRHVRFAKNVAVLAPRCQVGDDIVIDGDCQISGAMLFPHADIHGDVYLDDVTIENQDDRTLDLGRATVRGSVLGRRMTSAGRCWLAGAEIDASLALDDAVLTDPSGPTLLHGANLKVGGDVRLNGVRAVGGAIRFRAAQIGGDVDAGGAVLHNPNGETLSLSNATIAGAIRLTDIRSNGLLSINRASVGGRLRLTRAILECHATWDKNLGGEALEVISSDLRGGAYLDWERLEPSLDFFSSTTTVFADDPSTWPSRADLSGFTYDRFDIPSPEGRRDPWRVADRLKILRSQDPFDLGPYEQAARVYRTHGRFTDADDILVAGRRHARAIAGGDSSTRKWHEGPQHSLAQLQIVRRVQRRLQRIGSLMYDLTVRYGFRPARAMGFLVALIALVSLSLLPVHARDSTFRATGGSEQIYSPSGPLSPPVTASDACGGGDVRCFRPVLYAIETVVPLLDLGQRSTWYVQTSSRYGRWYEVWLTFATIAGWTLSTVFLLSFSRLGRANS